ncbi:hypothetical protein HDE_12353 [Halotydeus destructor]|nr:hypothetical protein HDE_12353 [Halotydeus destructor]
MGLRTISDVTKGQVLALLSLKYSYSMIVKKLQQSNIVLSKSSISRIRYHEENLKKNANRTFKPRGPKPKLTKADLNRIVTLTKKPNPPSRSQLAKKFKVSNTLIHKTFKRLNLA